MRSRRLLVSLCALALLVGSTGCGTEGRSPDPAVAGPAWERLPDPPLAARSGPVVAWDGNQVFVVGGDTSAPCPPNADCEAPDHYARDGARLDPGSGAWLPMAVAPLDVPAYAASAVVSGNLYLLAGESLLAYDTARDTWSQVATPSGFTGGQLVAAANRLVVVSDSDERGAVPDRVYDPSGRRWSTLPDDPIGPAFDRVVTAIPTGLVLTAHALVDNPGADGPSLVLAARFDTATAAWTRLPDSDQVGGWAWTWTGRRMVDPSLGGSDGGHVGNYGRTVPNGGILEPATGRWSRLPHAPAEGTGGWPVAALGGRFAAVGGWRYDDDTEAWAKLPAPRNAPDQPGSAVWAGDRLVVVGGIHARHGYTVKALSRHAWISPSGETLGLARQ